MGFLSFFFVFVKFPSAVAEDKLSQETDPSEPNVKLLQSPVAPLQVLFGYHGYHGWRQIASWQARGNRDITPLVCVCTCAWADREEDSGGHSWKEIARSQWRRSRQRVIEGERKLQRFDGAHHTVPSPLQTPMLGWPLSGQTLSLPPWPPHSQEL